MSLSEAERAFAEVHRVAHLATAAADGRPHVVPLCYALDGDRVYFVVDEKPKTSKSLRRLRNLDENPRAALIIDDYDDDWRHLAYLLLEGAAAPVDGPAEYARVIQLLRARYAPYRTMPLSQAINPMVRITIDKSHFWRIR